MTGYQENPDDPSYAGQIITFTFPHIGNVGANHEDIETTTPVARGLVLSAAISEPSSWRAAPTSRCLAEIAQPGGLGRHRYATGSHGASEMAAHPAAVVAHAVDGRFDLAALKANAAQCLVLDGMDLATSQLSAKLSLGGDALGPGPGYGTQKRHAAMWSPSITRQAQHPALPCQCGALACRGSGHRHRRREFWRTSRREFFSPTVPRSVGDRQLWPFADDQKLLAAEIPLFGICLGINCWRSRGRPHRRKCIWAIAAPIHRSRISPPARGDHQPEPRLRRACGVAAGRHRHPCLAVRRFQRRPRH